MEHPPFPASPEPKNGQGASKKPYLPVVEMKESDKKVIRWGLGLDDDTPDAVVEQERVKKREALLKWLIKYADTQL